MRENKELDVAIELFNSELEKLKEEKKAQDLVRKAEREKAAAVKELQDAEKNPNLSAEEKAAAKDKWIQADANLKVILAGGQPDMSSEDEQADESAEAADEKEKDTSTPDDDAEPAGESAEAADEKEEDTSTPDDDAEPADESAEAADEKEEDTSTPDDDAEPAEIIDDPDVLGCGVPIEQMQETVKEDKQVNQDDSEDSAADAESEDLAAEDA